MRRALGKLVLTAVLLAAVAGAIVYADGDPAVPEARADILDLSTITESDRAFRQALDDLGHEKAREYVLNGNQIRVSTAQLGSPPRRAMERYQNAFVRRGLNDDTYTSLSPARAMQRTKAGLTGGVVPAVVAPDRVIMRGVSTGDDPSSFTALLDRPLDTDGTSSAMAETFEGFRWVELHRPSAGSPTTAVAIWSGEDFDYDRMFPDALEKRAERADLDLPPCPNCVLINQFSDPDRSGRSEAYLFVSQRAPDRMANYYADRCEREDAQSPEPRRWFDRLRRRFEFEGGQIRRVRCKHAGQTYSLKLFPSARGRTAVRMEAVPAAPRAQSDEVNQQ